MSFFSRWPDLGTLRDNQHFKVAFAVLALAAAAISVSVFAYKRYSATRQHDTHVEESQVDKVGEETPAYVNLITFVLVWVAILVAILSFRFILYKLMRCLVVVCGARAAATRPLVHSTTPTTTNYHSISTPVHFDVQEFEREAGGETCSICLEPCDGMVTRLECKHEVHSACAAGWLYTKQNCPICRYEVGFKSVSGDVVETTISRDTLQVDQ